MHDRIGLLVTLILTYVAYKFSVSARLPLLPYLTLLDKYLLCLFCFYLSAGLETMLLQVLVQCGVPHDSLKVPWDLIITHTIITI